MTQSVLRVQTAKVQVFYTHGNVHSTLHTVYSALPILTPGGTTVCTTDPTSQNAALKFKSSTQAVLTTLAGSTHPLYLAFTALLASIAWLYLPLPLHLYLLMHFSTDPTCWYATCYYYPLYYPTWCMCLPCLRHPSTPDNIKNSSTSPPHGRERTTL